MREEWDWEFTDSARRQFDRLDDYARERIVSRRDAVVTEPWRDPWEYLEPLSGTPQQKLRVGPFHRGCRADRNGHVPYVLSIRKRGGDAFRGDDD